VSVCVRECVGVCERKEVNSKCQKEKSFGKSQVWGVGSCFYKGKVSAFCCQKCLFFVLF
jgi:hypothetical protein